MQRLGSQTAKILDVEAEVDTNGLQQVVESTLVVSHCGGWKQAFDKSADDITRHFMACLAERLVVEHGVASCVVVQGLPFDDAGEVVRNDADRLGVLLDGRLHMLDEALRVLRVVTRQPAAHRDEGAVFQRQNEPRRAVLSLSATPTPELAVNAGCLVHLRADDVESQPELHRSLVVPPLDHESGIRDVKGGSQFGDLRGKRVNDIP